MQLSRCILKKNEKKVVIQGLVHGIPKPFVVWIRKDIGRHVKNGYRIFYEGVRKYEDDENGDFSEKELEVIRCRELIEKLKEEAIKNLGLEFQNDHEGIEYPKNAINIDISWVEYIKLLAQKDVDCKGLLKILESVPREKFMTGLVETTGKLLNGETTLKELDITAKSIEFFRVADLVDLNYRNEVAAEKIEKYSKRRRFDKIYVQFGESHIEGIVDLLTNKYNWKLTKKVNIDLESPKLRNNEMRFKK